MTANHHAEEHAIRLNLGKARKALRWYEERVRFLHDAWLAFQENEDPNKYHVCDQIDAENDLISDGGQRARDALGEST